MAGLGKARQGEEMTRYFKCQMDGCENPASWTAGTWSFCDEHIEVVAFEDPEIREVFGSPYGTVGHSSKEFLTRWAEQYFSGCDYMFVEVEDAVEEPERQVQA
jgi:hypothetical protein